MKHLHHIANWFLTGNEADLNIDTTEIVGLPKNESSPAKQNLIMKCARRLKFAALTTTEFPKLDVRKNIREWWKANCPKALEVLVLGLKAKFQLNKDCIGIIYNIEPSITCDNEEANELISKGFCGKSLMESLKDVHLTNDGITYKMDHFNWVRISADKKTNKVTSIYFEDVKIEDIIFAPIKHNKLPFVFFKREVKFKGQDRTYYYLLCEGESYYYIFMKLPNDFHLKEEEHTGANANNPEKENKNPDGLMFEKISDFVNREYADNENINNPFEALKKILAQKKDQISQKQIDDLEDTIGSEHNIYISRQQSVPPLEGFFNGLKYVDSKGCHESIFETSVSTALKYVENAHLNNKHNATHGQSIMIIDTVACVDEKTQKRCKDKSCSNCAGTGKKGTSIAVDLGGVSYRIFPNEQARSEAKPIKDSVHIVQTPDYLMERSERLENKFSEKICSDFQGGSDKLNVNGLNSSSNNKTTATQWLLQSHAPLQKKLLDLAKPIISQAVYVAKIISYCVDGQDRKIQCEVVKDHNLQQVTEITDKVHNNDLPEKLKIDWYKKFIRLTKSNNSLEERQFIGSIKLHPLNRYSINQQNQMDLDLENSDIAKKARLHDTAIMNIELQHEEKEGTMFVWDLKFEDVKVLYQTEINRLIDQDINEPNRVGV